MRLRNVKAAFERIDSFPQIVQEPQQYKGKWKELFGNDNPIHIEIGMGKAGFLIGMAKQNPGVNYIGFEKFTVVLVKGLEKLEKEEGLDNIRVVRFDAEYILDLFDEGEIDRVYLNFSDPWPKDRHYKRRLTYRDFLNKYKTILKEDGLVRFKTDNVGLFDFSLEEMEAADMELLKVTRDLHNSQYIEGNVMTEYETKFSSDGIPINMVEGCFKNFSS